MKRIAVAVAVLLLCAEGLSAQENLETGSSVVADTIKTKGFVPLALLQDSFDTCRDAIGGEEGSVSLDYCGVILVGAMQNAMRFTVGDVAIDRSGAAARAKINELEEKYAAEMTQTFALNKALLEERDKLKKSNRQVEVYQKQISALRSHISSLQRLLDEAELRDADHQDQLEKLGSELNRALARVAAEERKRRMAEQEASQTEEKSTGDQ
jgi:hypothetical protein